VILGHQWYNLQSTRKYPLADNASGTDDTGARLPDHILADMHVRWPDNLGSYAFVSGITVTPRIVTLVLNAAIAPTGGSSFAPLAAVTLAQPVKKFQHYALTPFQSGVGGYVVFGDTSQPFIGRFSQPGQSLLLSRCARAYRQPPIRSLGKTGRSTSLQGLVLLVGGNDVSVTKERITIEGTERDALVFRLVSPIAGRQILREYTGPCGKRPESRTCPQPGIERINNIGPDCNGNINIVVDGVDTGSWCDSAWTGQTLNTDIGIDALCRPTDIDRFAGQDLCDSSSLSTGIGSRGIPAAFFTVVSSISLPEPLPALLDAFMLPLDDDFRVARSWWEVLSGNFTRGDGWYQSTTSNQRNLAILHPTINAKDVSQVRCQVQLIPGGTSNGGLVLNYRPVRRGALRTEYHMVTLHTAAPQLRVFWFNGTSLIPESSATLDHIQLGRWYELAVDTAGTQMQVHIRDTTLRGSTRTMTCSVPNYGTGAGRYGLGSEAAVSLFTDFAIHGG
jgi:hypothetical protein